MKVANERPYTFDRVIRLLISLLLIIVSIYLIYRLRDVLLPFLIAWLIAYLLNPIVRFLQKGLHLKKRYLAVLLTFMLVVGSITLIVWGVTPMVKKEIVQINKLITAYQLQSISIDGMPVNIHDFLQKNIDFESIKQLLSKENISETLKFLMPTVQNVLTSSISFIWGFTVVFVVILYLIFILLDYDKINLLWMTLIPYKHRRFVGKLTLDVEKSMNNYFRHQALICLIVGTLFCICFQIVGLPLAIVLGVIIGIMHMVPYLHTISIIPAIMLCWLKVSQTGGNFWTMVGIIVLIYIGIQCIIDLVLTPRIMGKAMGLNPAIILLSLSIWGSLMGVVGMIIAIPLTTLLLSYYQEFIDSKSDEDIEHYTERVDQEIQNE